MKLLTLSLLTCCVFAACSRTAPEHPVRVTASTDLARLIGHRVELLGTVSGDRVPQVQGVDLWGMESFRGRRVRASGILQRTVSTRDGLDYGRGQDSGRDGFVPPVYRGAGTFYRLQGMRYEIDP